MSQKKRVLLVTQYFYPENFKGNDIAFELVKRGYDVDVLTAIPNYPQGHFYPGYGYFKKKHEVINGVNVHRIFTIPRFQNKIGLVLNYLAFWIWGMIRAVFLSLGNKYDCVFVQQLSPVMSAYPGMVVSGIQHIPLYVWVLDLWPESLTATTGIQNKSIINFFTSVTTRVYKTATKILISSRGFRQSILEKGDFADKLEYFPNWAENVFSSNTKIAIPELPSGFKVMFAGNIGEAQDFDHVMQGALRLKDHKDIHFIIVGDGRKKDWVDLFVKDNGLQDTVHLLGRHPIETMPLFFEEADCMLVSLKDDLIFNLTVPAKLQAYMAAGKPILGMINGEAQQLIKDSHCGLASDAGDIEAFVENILEMSQKSEQELQNLGQSSVNYYNCNFAKENCMNHLCEILDM